MAYGTQIKYKVWLEGEHGQVRDAGVKDGRIADLKNKCLLATASASVLARFFRLCSQLLWCELYDMRDIQQQQN